MHMQWKYIEGKFMKNKDIESIADKSIEHLQNNDFHEKLMSAYDTRSGNINKVGKKFKLKAVWSAICIVVILAIIIPCGIIFSNKESVENDSTENKYCYEDELAVSADLDEVNSVLYGYRIKPDYITNISLVKDSKSGDELYYIIEMQDEGFTTCRIDLVVNPDYEYIEKVTNERVEANGLNIDCRRISNFEEKYGVYTHTVYGETKIQNLRVYFNVYDTFSEGADDGFIEFVQNTFIKA